MADNTYLGVLDRMLAKVADKYDKRESSIIYNALAPAAMELSNVYLELDQIEREGFADTADLYYLKRRAAERGLTAKQASAAILKCRFDKEIDKGTHFTGINTTLNYTVYEYIESKEESGTTYYYYRCVCDDTGEQGNSYLGDIIPLDSDITGLGTAELTEILVHGEDEEDAEDFRQRYFDSIENQSFGGNVQAYKTTVTDIDGVGGCKVYPAWNGGGGTVKIVITDSSNNKPSEELVAEVKDTLDPEKQTGKGAGLAPIGHKVTVAGADIDYIKIVPKVQYQTGYTEIDVKDAYNQSIDGYLAELNADWQDSERIVVRRSHLMSRLTAVEGILDVTDLTINGEAKNYEANADNIVLREVS